MMDKIVLITGGSGHIGSEIVKKFVKSGVKPYLLLRPEFNRERIEKILSKCEVIECDINDSEKIKQKFEQIKPNTVIHLASSGVNTYTDEDEKNRNEILNINIKGTLNLLTAAVESGCETFIYTGSCFEYGNNDRPFTEEDVCRPVNLYGATKLAGTLLAQMFYRNHRLGVVVIRPFTVYGPHEEKGRFIKTVISNCLTKQEIPLVNETIVRDYIFIDDVVDGYFCALKFRDELNGEVVNISTGRGSTLNEVAEKIKTLTGATDVPIIAGAFPTRTGEVFSLVGSPQKAKKIMDWKPKYTLSQGLKITISSFKNELPSQ